MKRIVICPHCGHQIPESPKEEEARSEEIVFTVDGVPIKGMAIREDTSFWRITKGKYTGNLVHIFNVLKK